MCAPPRAAGRGSVHCVQTTVGGKIRSECRAAVVTITVTTSLLSEVVRSDEIVARDDAQHLVVRVDHYEVSQAKCAEDPIGALNVKEKFRYIDATL